MGTWCLAMPPVPLLQPPTESLELGPVPASGTRCSLDRRTSRDRPHVLHRSWSRLARDPSKTKQCRI